MLPKNGHHALYYYSRGQQLRLIALYSEGSFCRVCLLEVSYNIYVQGALLTRKKTKRE